MRRMMVSMALAWGLMGCEVKDSSSIEIPSGVRADLWIDVDEGDAQAYCQAQFWDGTTTVDLTEGERVHCNGTRLSKFSGLGIYYGGETPLVDPGDTYTIQLEVPGKGTFDTSIAMVTAATLTAPADAAEHSVAAPLTITLSGAETGTLDSLELIFNPNPGGQRASETFKLAAGQTTLELTATALQALFDEAAGPNDAPVTATLTLQRQRDAAVHPGYASGVIRLQRTLDSRDLVFTR